MTADHRSASPGHVDDVLLERYATATLPDVAAWSVEAHVASCGQCRARVRPVATEVGVDSAHLDEVWNEVSAQVRARQRTWTERALVAVGVADSDARLLAATRSLTVPWLFGVALVLAASAGAAAFGTVGSTPALLAFLLLVPLVPVAGVAVAFGPRVDPAYELAASAPTSALRLLLLRTVAVLASSLTLAVAASLFLTPAGWWAVAWLLPALALTSLVLAASTRWRPAGAAAVIGTGWIASVVVLEGRLDATLAAFGATGQATMVGLLTVSVTVFMLSRERIDPLVRQVPR